MAAVTRYPARVMRSATAPDTIVVAVAQNANWKKKNAPASADDTPGIAACDKSKKFPFVPIRPSAVTPNMNANPNAQKINAAKQKSAMFLMATLTLFFALTLPVSRHTKPACIMRTKTVQTSTHVTSNETASDTVNPHYIIMHHRRTFMLGKIGLHSVSYRPPVAVGASYSV